MHASRLKARREGSKGDIKTSESEKRVSREGRERRKEDGKTLIIQKPA